MELLRDLILVVLAATVLVALVHRLKLPSILGFLLTGLLVGPVGFGLVSDSKEIHVIAEMGVVLLMFTIGLEISLADLVRMARKVVAGGLTQMVATTGAFAGVAVWAGFAPRDALVMGLLVATSSTALVLRLLGDRGELSTPYGQLALAILLMQDFAVVALMLLVPMLADADASWVGAAWSVGKAVVFGTGIFVVARFVFPWVLGHVVALRSREVFLLATLVAVFGTSLIADFFGLSLAIGAFIAGLVVSESEFSHQMFAEILPFRDLFNGLFFVSIGLLLEPLILVEGAGAIVGTITLVLVGKAVIVMGVARAFRLSWLDSFLSGVALAQVGEFGLVLAQLARSLELINPYQHGILIAVAVATITLTPLHLIASRRLARRWRTREIVHVGPKEALDGHVIVVGYGLNGRNVARALRMLDVPFIVVEMNASTVERERAGGLPIVLGDATRPALLHHLSIDKARALVAAVADAAATREIVANAYHANPDLEIIARTRYIAEMAPLIELGATQVVPEEFETSIELVGRVMETYGASTRVVEGEKRRLRRQHYNVLLRQSATGEEDPHPITDLLAALDIERVEVEAGSPVVNRTLREINLRAETGANVIAILRQGADGALTPTPDFVFREGDIAVLAGDMSGLEEAELLLAPSRGRASG